MMAEINIVKQIIYEKILKLLYKYYLVRKKKLIVFYKHKKILKLSQIKYPIKV